MFHRFKNFYIGLLLSALGLFIASASATKASVEEESGAASVHLNDSEVASVYGADLKPFRDQTEIVTRWDGQKSPYCITGFIRIRLTSDTPVAPERVKEVKLHIKTREKVAEDETHPVVLGYTLDEFEPFRMTLEAYDGEHPWEQGPNAGINPGQRKYPNVLVILHGVTEPETSYEFSSEELTAYIISQLKNGKDAFLYLSQGNPAKRLRFISYHGPSSADAPYLEIITQ